MGNVESCIEKDISANNTPKYYGALEEFKSIKRLLHLKSKERFPISRVYLSGSLSKGTALEYHFDIDIVVFIPVNSHKEYMTKRKKALNELYLIFLNHYENCTLKETSIKLKSKNGLKIDVKTAADFMSSNQVKTCSELIYITSKPKEVAFDLQTSVCEYGDTFVANQSEFVKQLIILCKHWCRKILQGSVTAKGRSSLIELIAIHVGKEIETSVLFTSNRLGLAFKRFLEYCIDFDKLAIRFPFPYSHKTVHFNTPYVIEPSNPYNNRAASFNGNLQEKQILSYKAKCTVHDLERCMQQNSQDVLANFFKTFQTPQPDDDSWKFGLAVGTAAAGVALLGIGIGCYLNKEESSEKKKDKKLKD